MLEIRKEEGHPSRWAITRAWTGDLEGCEADEIMVHVSKCKECTEILKILEMQKQEFVNSPVMTRTRMRLKNESKSGVRYFAMKILRIKLLVPAISLAAAAIALALFFPKIGRQDIESPYATRSKGAKGLELHYALLTSSGPVERKSGDLLDPGSRIQFMFKADAPGFLYMASLDSRGKVTALYPGTTKNKPVSPGRMSPLPNSIILDDASFERVFALLCPDPLPRNRLEHVLALEFAEKGSVRRIEHVSMGHCEQVYVDLPRRLP
ncbi:MAG: DUF4384 domain-containing protein [Deltaproteobacteria bacterium]|nr:DUF4384 domain-containing protein [Deltaproteobacteria bacterium]